MNEILFILICLFVFGCNSKSQNNHVIKKSSGNEDVFHLKSTKIQYFIKFEKELGSKSVELDGNYITPSKYNLAQPLIFQRTEGDFYPFLRIKYHFSLPDSIVRLIDYDWDVLNYIDISNYNNIKNSKGEPEKRINDYNKKYENLKNELTQKIGKSKQSESDLKFTKAGEEKYCNRDDNWETKDYSISLNLIFTSDSSSLGTSRIRARVDWNSSPNLSKPDNQEQSKIAKDFITSIMNENYDKAWSFVDDEY
jgi:hypothetical protein